MDTRTTDDRIDALCRVLGWYERQPGLTPEEAHDYDLLIDELADLTDDYFTFPVVRPVVRED